MRVALLYGSGAAMGFSPQEVDRMSYWQFMAALLGYVKANSASGGDKLSEQEKDWLWEGLEPAPGPRTLSTFVYQWFGAEPVNVGRVTFSVS